MREQYYRHLKKPKGLAHIDLEEIYANYHTFRSLNPKRWLISYVEVPPKHRGKGIGRKLFKTVLAAADREGVVLCLDIWPFGEMTYDALREWYERLGFVKQKRGYLWVRKPIVKGKNDRRKKSPKRKKRT